MYSELLDSLVYELGEIHRWEEECPGAYYLAILLESGGAEVLAVCFPIWDGELSEGLAAVGQKQEMEGDMGYLYFLKDAACVAVWELLCTRRELVTTGLICKPELMNAIWTYQPGYALGYNTQEQVRLHDTLGLLLYALGWRTGNWRVRRNT